METASEQTTVAHVRYELIQLFVPVVPAPVGVEGCWWIVGWHPIEMTELMCLATDYDAPNGPPDPSAIANRRNRTALRDWPLGARVVYAPSMRGAREQWRAAEAGA